MTTATISDETDRRAGDEARQVRSEGVSLALQCPACGEALGALREASGLDSLSCPACRYLLSCSDGIWKAIRPEREQHFACFMEQYQAIRAGEGRGSTDSDFYLALPYRDLSNRNPWQWQIRGNTYRYFEKHVLPGMERDCPKGLDILDAGAGNCWMSYRLALRGHRPVAMDLLINDTDGLGAASHYKSALPGLFPRFQAEIDALPFATGSFDLIVFNAAFHYSEDYVSTIAKAMRCLRSTGSIVILDSPFYYSKKSGEQMVAEKHKIFQEKFGFRSDSIRSQEFLSPELLDEIADSHGLEWQVFKPWYGLGWALRPIRAWFGRKREPSRFYIFQARLRASAGAGGSV